MSEPIEETPAAPQGAAEPDGKETAAAVAPAEEEVAAVYASVTERRRELKYNPRICSQCMMGERDGSMFVETKGEEGRVMLCSLRCMALWAMARGWKR